MITDVILYPDNVSFYDLNGYGNISIYLPDYLSGPYNVESYTEEQIVITNGEKRATFERHGDLVSMDDV